MKRLVTALIILSAATHVAAQEQLPTTRSQAPIQYDVVEKKLETVKTDSLALTKLMTPFRVMLITKPAISVLSIEVSPNKAANAEVYLINSIGEKVRSFLKGTLKTGKTDFAIDTRTLPVGLYYIVSVIEGRQYAEKITVAAK